MWSSPRANPKSPCAIRAFSTKASHRSPGYRSPPARVKSTRGLMKSDTGAGVEPFRKYECHACSWKCFCRGKICYFRKTCVCSGKSDSDSASSPSSSNRPGHRRGRPSSAKSEKTESAQEEGPKLSSSWLVASRDPSGVRRLVLLPHSSCAPVIRCSSRA